MVFSAHVFLVFGMSVHVCTIVGTFPVEPLAVDGLELSPTSDLKHNQTEQLEHYILIFGTHNY